MSCMYRNKYMFYTLLVGVVAVLMAFSAASVTVAAAAASVACSSLYKVHDR